MYGTIAKVRIDPNRLEEVKAVGASMGTAPGQVTRYVYQMDADPGVLFLVAVFESREAYWANAASPDAAFTSTFSAVGSILLKPGAKGHFGLTYAMPRDVVVVCPKSSTCTRRKESK